jgi:Ca2+-binding EF-hand superfamily protein
VEFIEGMTTLFSEQFEKQIVFIFNLYDFDKDGFISKEEVRTVLSYVPLKSKHIADKLKFEKFIFLILEKLSRIELNLKRNCMVF